MLDFITHIGLITVISWCLSELWDMPGQALKEWNEIKKDSKGLQSQKSL